MCLNTCIKKRTKTIHSVLCSQFREFGDGQAIPFDWGLMTLDERIKMKQNFSRRRRHPRTLGSLNTKHLNEFIRKMKASTLDDVIDL